MGAIGHPVCGQQFIQGVDHRLTRHPDIQVDGGRSGKQPVQMRIQKDQRPLVQPQAFPHPVPHHEAGVEDGYLRFGFRNQRPVQPDQGGLVTRICRKILTASHGAPRSIEALSLSVPPGEANSETNRHVIPQRRPLSRPAGRASIRQLN
jgi:hypothetical protein